MDKSSVYALYTTDGQTDRRTDGKVISLVEPLLVNTIIRSIRIVNRPTAVFCDCIIMCAYSVLFILFVCLYFCLLTFC